LLIAMGISVATTVSAKSIAVNSQAKSDVAATAAASAGTPVPISPASQSGIFAGDSGTPDLGKVQVVLWTLITVGVFLSLVFATINQEWPFFKANASYHLILPDIGQTLMILMGLGHGSYIGKKIAES
jgi:hypothetical protein